MSVSISQVHGWDLGALHLAADNATSDAESFEAVALTVTNGFDGVKSDWDGEARDKAHVQVIDQATDLNDRATRWRQASDRLRLAAEQLALLKAEIERLVNEAESKSSMVGPIYLIGDDGSVSVSQAFIAVYAAQLGPHPGSDVVSEATAMAVELQEILQRLLANAAVAAEYYDWQITNALLGVSDADRPFTPAYVPPVPPKPTTSTTVANRRGHGPSSYGVDTPGLVDSTYMTGLRLAAQAAANRSETLAPMASDMLRHYFDNSGTDYHVNVGALLAMPRFSRDADDSAKAEFVNARGSLPQGYTGPVVFDGEFTGNQVFRPSPSEGLDALGGLGSFSYQSSGVAIPAEGGGYSIDYVTSVYDYYDWDPTGHTNSEQYSDLNDLHRAGWAQNFEVVGRSGIRETEWSR